MNEKYTQKCTQFIYFFDKCKSKSVSNINLVIFGCCIHKKMKEFSINLS